MEVTLSHISVKFRNVKKNEFKWYTNKDIFPVNIGIFRINALLFMNL